MENYYSILECSIEDSPEKIKRNFQNLVKKYHPDKGAPSSEKFLLLDKAYKTLRDKENRKKYDSLLYANSCDANNSLIYMRINKKDVNLNEDGKKLYSCRCGEQFVIEQIHLDEEECVIECTECSNSILIL